MGSIDKRLEAALPEKPTKNGVTTVPDSDIRAAVAHIRKNDTAKTWRW